MLYCRSSLVICFICSIHHSVYVNSRLLVYPSPYFPFVNRIETLNQSFVLLQSPRIFKPNGSSKIRIEAEYFASWWGMWMKRIVGWGLCVYCSVAEPFWPMCRWWNHSGVFLYWQNWDNPLSVCALSFPSAPSVIFLGSFVHLQEKKILSHTYMHT